MKKTSNNYSLITLKTILWLVAAGVVLLLSDNNIFLSFFAQDLIDATGDITLGITDSNLFE